MNYEEIRRERDDVFARVDRLVDERDRLIAERDECRRELRRMTEAYHVQAAGRLDAEHRLTAAGGRRESYSPAGIAEWLRAEATRFDDKATRGPLYHRLAWEREAGRLRDAALILEGKT